MSSKLTALTTNPSPLQTDLIYVVPAAGGNQYKAALSAYSLVSGPASAVSNEVAVFSGTTGKIVKQADGPITLTAAGTNQNITLTPSGTGRARVSRTAADAIFSVGAVTSGVSIFAMEGYSNSTTLAATFGGGGNITLQNLDTTAGNYSHVTGLDAGGNAVNRIAFVNINDATNEGRIAFMTRPSGGSLTEVGSWASNGALALPSTNTAGIQLFNTVDQVTNVQRLSAYWSSNRSIIANNYLGSGTNVPLIVGAFDTTNAYGSYMKVDTSSRAVSFYALANLSTDSTQATGLSTIGWRFLGLNNTSTSGTINPFSIAVTYNQASGTAANTDLLVNRTQTAVGSGTQRLLDLQVGGVSQFAVSNTGVFTCGNTVASAVAVASTHKVTVVIAGTTYYLLASNV